MSVARWLIIAGMVLGILVGAMIGLGALFLAQDRAREAQAFPGCFQRAAFDAFVQGLPAPRGGEDLFEPVTVPNLIGACKIGSAYAVDGGYIFYAGEYETLLGFDDVGWGYFPGGFGTGLGNGAWEGPRFRMLDGPWYTWSASW
nr:hypothetical protein GCM10020063_018630 [Dactylosporangium thailandense]